MLISTLLAIGQVMVTFDSMSISIRTLLDLVKPPLKTTSLEQYATKLLDIVYPVQF
jgi:hypothetical protein